MSDRIQFEPMKPMTADDIKSHAQNSRNSADEWRQTADASEKAAALLVQKAKNCRDIAAEIDRIKRRRT